MIKALLSYDHMWVYYTKGTIYWNFVYIRFYTNIARYLPRARYSWGRRGQAPGRALNASVHLATLSHANRGCTPSGCCAPVTHTDTVICTQTVTYTLMTSYGSTRSYAHTGSYKQSNITIFKLSFSWLRVRKSASAYQKMLYVHEISAKNTLRVLHWHPWDWM